MGVDYVYLGGGAGSFRPKKISQIRLVREELEITLTGPARRSRAAAGDGPPWSHQVRARYQLSNQGAAQAALYAVPVVLPAEPVVYDAGSAVVSMSAKDVAATVRIAVGSTEHRCELHPEPAVPPGAAPSDLLPIGAHLGSLGTALAGFCVAELTLPAGEFELVLSYSAPLLALDETHPNPECDLRPREPCIVQKKRRGYFLYYPFGGAASWAGRPERVVVAVKLGGLRVERGRSEGLPDDAVESGGVLRWSWKRPELQGLDLVLQLKAPGTDTFRGFDGDYAGQASACGPEIETAASSVLADLGARSYGPEKAVDGSAATAWCVRTDSGAVGEWIELRFEPPPGLMKSYGLYVLPGLAGSQRLYEGNGRVTRIRYGACTPGAAGTVADLPVKDDLLESVVQVPGSEAVLDAILKETRKGEKACLRVHIAATRPGSKSPDVCISELSLPMRCYH